MKSLFVKKKNHLFGAIIPVWMKSGLKWLNRFEFYIKILYGDDWFSHVT